MTETKFGRYEINSELGRGGMATVFHANDPRFERDVAIKVLPREFLHDPQFRARFEREAKTIALLEHPAIVPVYDFGDQDGQPYIVMRYMSGGSLAERLQAGALPLIEVSQIISRLAPALDAAHKKGVIHRDLKPGNILFDQYGNAYVSDFGIARLTESGGSNLTGTAILGTPAYMSPEQVQGDSEIDGRSDIYALGVMLFQMLTGSMPYQADTPAKVMMMHLLEPVPQIKRVKNDLPSSFDAITERALAKSPDDRYQNANDMAMDVEDAAYSFAENAQDSAEGDPSMATRVAGGPTKVSRPPTRPPTRPPARSRTTPLPAKTPPRVAAEPIPAPARSGWRMGGVIIGLMGALGVLGVLALLAVIFLPPIFFPKPTATLMPTTAVAVIAATDTAAPLPTDTAIPTEQPSATPEPTATLQPTETPTEAPTETVAPTETPAPSETPQGLQAIGGADKLALLDGQNNVWVMNVDGSEAMKLTIDGTVKNNLQWSPDGLAVVYISGNCAKMVNIETSRVEDIACFDAANPNELYSFQISPDGTQVAVTFYNQMYIVPFNLEQLATTRRLSDLKANAVCEKLGPYSSNTGTAMGIEWVQWGKDMQHIAVIVQGVDKGKLVDLIDLLDISNCDFGPSRKDEFPATRFEVANYQNNPNFENFAWDGEYLFSFVGGTIRNGGFADIYLYSSQSQQGQRLNPVGNGTCCYRDPSWSPDGRYLVVVFQDVTLGTQNVTQIYLIQYGSIGTGTTYPPLPLPEGFFSNRKDRPMPVLRPAK